MIVAEHPPELSAEDEADLVAYVDGRLDAQGRARVEARAGADPVYAAALARQREGHAAISRAAETTGAPLALRSRVEAMGAGRERRHGARGPSVRTRLGGIRWPAAGAVAGAGGGGGGGGGRRRARRGDARGGRPGHRRRRRGGGAAAGRRRRARATGL